MRPSPEASGDDAAEYPALRGFAVPPDYGGGTSAGEDFLLDGGYLQALGEAFEGFKAEHALPITLGAWHWWHVNAGGPLPSGYGIPQSSTPGYPAINGTYYYSLEANPEFACSLDPFTTMGVFADVQLRDGGTPLRPFYPEGVAWLQQGYVWGLTPLGGVLKAGSVWRRFGLDWDGSWWGNVQYFDGFKLNTDWGVSWEVTPEMEDGFKIERFFQYFIHENNINGSLTGADPESVIGSSQRNTLVARVAPSWQLGPDETLTLGLSGLVGQIHNAAQLSMPGRSEVWPSPGDQTPAAWAADVTYTQGGWKLFAEGLQAYGVLSPARDVSGGPSNRLTDLLAGVNWTRGPITYRFCYSIGMDDNPWGVQQLYVPGVTIALTKNVECYAEYVHQDVRRASTPGAVTWENGVQLLVHWHL